MRVVTLLPAATEIVAALGGAGSLVGISHECDHPASVLRLPRVTATPIDPGAPGAAIDAEVRRLQAAGRPVIGVDADALRRLAPDLLITQDLCEVCAVAEGEVHRLAAAVQPAPAVLSLSGRTIEGIMADVGAVARALDLAPDGEELLAGLRSRLERLRARRQDGSRPRVVCIEWLEPLYLAGHWVPEMVETAGGEDVGARAGSHSARRDWSELPGLRPDLIVIMLCGFGVERSLAELSALGSSAAPILRAAPVWVIDANAYTSRSGPRIVDGVELLQGALLGREAPGMMRWRCDAG